MQDVQRTQIPIFSPEAVKGLEFDYVVLVECNTASFGTNDEARHLLHRALARLERVPGGARRRGRRGRLLRIVTLTSR